jgi:hypothetical protein
MNQPMLKFAETRYGLTPLTSRDSAASNMSDSFDFTQQPLAVFILKARHCQVKPIGWLPTRLVGSTPQGLLLLVGQGPNPPISRT